MRLDLWLRGFIAEFLSSSKGFTGHLGLILIVYQLHPGMDVLPCIVAGGDSCCTEGICGSIGSLLSCICPAYGGRCSSLWG